MRSRVVGAKAAATLATCSASVLITSVVVTAGNAPDGQQLPQLLARDLAQGVPVGIVAADRGCDDGDNHLLLVSKGASSAIRLNDYRTKKKDGNKEAWQRLQAAAEYQLGLKERYKIERTFGEATSPCARQQYGRVVRRSSLAGLAHAEGGTEPGSW